MHCREQKNEVFIKTKPRPQAVYEQHRRTVRCTKSRDQRGARNAHGVHEINYAHRKYEVYVGFNLDCFLL